MKNDIRLSRWHIPGKWLLFHLLLIVSLALTPAFAYHYPWDQGHDTTDWNDPGNPGPPEKPLCDPCKPGSTRSPVYTATGNFIWSETDINMAGQPLIALSRTYNARDPRSGIFGNGWSSNTDIQLLKTYDKINQQTIYVLRMPSGKRFVYTQDPNDPNTFVSPAGQYNTVLPQDDGSVILQQPDGSTQHFDATGNIVSRTDIYGRVLTYEYNDSNQLSKIADSNGRYLLFSYNSNGRVANIDDHSGRSWSYSYDGNGNLTDVTNPLGDSRNYEYQTYDDPNDGFTYYQLTKITDESNVIVTQVTYDGQRVASYTEGENTFTYDYSYLDRYNYVSKTDAMGSTWRFTLNDDQLVIEDRDPAGRTEKYEYDANGNLTKYTDKNGKEWLASYDAQGRLISRTNPLGETTTLEYDDDSLKPARQISPSGRVVEYSYDDKLNMTQIKGPEAQIFALAWTTDGNLASVTDPLNNLSEQTEYNALGLPVKTTDAEGNVAEYTYDDRYNLIQVKAPNGTITRHEYDALDRLTKTTDALGNVTQYRYDRASRLIEVIAPNGKSIRYEYDTYGRRSKRVDFDGREETYTYRKDNLIESYTAKSGQVTNFTYDQNKQLIRVNSGSDYIWYYYTNVGLISRVSNNNGTLYFKYDDAGRIIEEQNNLRTMTYGYNNEGDMTSFKPFDEVLNYTYNKNGFVTKIKMQAGDIDLQYDALNRLTRLDLSTGSSIVYAYDKNGQMTSQQHNGSVTTAYQYQYDNMGRLTAWTGDNVNRSFEYDDIDRLTRAVLEGSGIDYSYDELGNPTDANQVYDDGNRLTEDDGHTYAYDPNGNLTLKQDKSTGARTEFGWNNLNRLVEIKTYPDAQSSTADSRTTYKYDAFGRRIEKKVDNTITKYQWNGSFLVAEYDRYNNWIQRYYYLPGMATPIQMEDQNGLYTVHSNYLGAPVFLLDENQDVVWTAQYDPYGQATVDSDPDGDGTDVVFNFRLPGQYYDAESGLHYNYFRYYDPATHRYLRSDPIGITAGINTYNYVGSNPVTATDYFGLDYKVTGRGNVITISATITIYGPHATDDLAKKWQKSINDNWNNFGNNFKYKNCKVVFRVRVQADNRHNTRATAASADNKIYVVNSANHRSYVQGSRYGQWSAQDDAWVSAHEAGHLFGLPDDYRDVGNRSVANAGHGGHMMAEYGGKVAQHEINDILKNTKCNCEKK